MGRGGISLQLKLLMAAVFGLVAVVFGYSAWDRSQRGPVIISSDPGLASVVVEVRGAVVRPGVYTLTGDGRVGQLVEMAGGLTSDADLRQVNLARRLADEELVIIPSLAPATPVGSPRDGVDVSPAITPVGVAGAINVNTASAPELEALPGIGEVLAARIVAFREANGPYSAVDDLTRVEGISETTVEELRDLVTVGP